MLGQAEAAAFLADKPVSLIYGVGKVASQRFAKDGFRLIADFQRAEERELVRRYGAEGLAARCRDIRKASTCASFDPRAATKERFGGNHLRNRYRLTFRPWRSGSGRRPRRCPTGSRKSRLTGSTVTLRLKTSDFRILTRARSLESPTQLAGKIFGAARDLLAREINGTRYRLLGVGVSGLADAEDADPADLIDQSGERRAAAERAMDRVRGKVRPRGHGQGPALKEQDDVALTPKPPKR